MADLLLYLGLAAAGYVLTTRLLKNRDLTLATMLQGWCMLISVQGFSGRTFTRLTEEKS